MFKKGPINSFQGGFPHLPLPPPPCGQLQCQHCHILLEGRKVPQVVVFVLAFVFVYPSLPDVKYCSLKFIIPNNTLLQITSVFCLILTILFNIYFRKIL